MRECPACFSCYDDTVIQCPVEGRSTFHSLPGDIALEGKYLLERRLGEGGMGIVYKAQHKFLKTNRAIKIIRPELVGNDHSSFATRFRQEAMAAAAIGHPNIISVQDFGFVEERIPYIVMEFVEGISLEDLMTRRGRFSPEETLEYISVIASALGAAHRHGIVHRDLKPLNIMIQHGGAVRDQLRVLDFGLAKIKSNELLGSFVGAKTTGIIGSPYYMAPEQWSEEETDQRCDIYSLGVILHQMLTGDVPFKGSGIPSIMKKHLMMPAPPLTLPGTGISSQLERVVHHALEKDPEKRTASAADLTAELEQAVAAARKTKTKVHRPSKVKTAAAPRQEVKEASHDQTEVLSSFIGVANRGAGREQQTMELRDIERLRDVEEIVEAPVVNDDFPLRQRRPPSLPGRLAIGQHSAPGIFLQKRFVLPVIGSVFLLGLIALFPFIYFRSETTPPLTRTTPAAKTAKGRDMILIDGGTFTMGSNQIDGQQKGLHRVSVAAFYIDKYEVTNADFAEFVKATDYPAPALDESDPNAGGGYWKPWNGTDPPQGRERWPVCNVSAKDAEAFARWLSERDGVKYRLPTEEEWEFAGRNGSRGSHFPWGDSWQEGRANLNQKSSPTDVGSFPEGATQDGVMDMIGNVWEWTSSKARYYDNSPVKQQYASARVRRGGSFFEKMNDGFEDATSRGWFGDEHFKFPTIGFRLARDRE
jgi:formylglycine-generating enzyme required for sulfatase activity/tRNA A-37 threonylcarbamoyl transferase component Bud32